MRERFAAGFSASARHRDRDVLILFAVVSLAALLLTGAASWLLAGDIGLLDSRLLVATRRLAVDGGLIGLAMRELMLSATALGAFATLAVMTLAAGGFLVSINRGPAALALVAKAGAGILLADLLKHVVDRPRPMIVAHWVDVTSSSFPSGHSADSAIVYFLLAALAIDHLGQSRAGTYVRRVSVALVLLVGISRMYLGVHYPTDVLPGGRSALRGSCSAGGCHRETLAHTSFAHARSTTSSSIPPSSCWSLPTSSSVGGQTGRCSGSAAMSVTAGSRSAFRWMSARGGLRSRLSAGSHKASGADR